MRLHFCTGLFSALKLELKRKLSLVKWDSVYYWGKDKNNFLLYKKMATLIYSFPCGSADKESSCNAGDQGSIPGLGRSPGEGNGNSFQYSCLGNPIDRRAYWATVYGVTESQAQLNDLHKHTYLQKYLWLFSLGAEWERLGWRWSEISLPNTENHISFLRRISQTRSYKLQQGNLWGGNSSYREYLAFFL